jgi:hypothetical protein
VSKKQDVSEELFRLSQPQGFRFHNRLVKQVSQDIGFGNHFDVTKIDSAAKLPSSIREQGYYVIHLGGGWHQFVRGVALVFHEFESPAESVDWAYQKIVVNHLSSRSEGTLLSFAFNKGIFQDFLGTTETLQANTIGRTNATFEFRIGNQSVSVNNLQLEIDYLVYTPSFVAPVEAKTRTGKAKLPVDFNVHQVYNSYRYLKNQGVANVRPLYCLSRQTATQRVFRLYEYRFNDHMRPDSLVLIDAR